jgi:hypothetical protein
MISIEKVFKIYEYRTEVYLRAKIIICAKVRKYKNKIYQDFDKDKKLK